MYSKYAALRDSKGMSDYEVAKRSGVGRSTISEWKQGKHTPNTENLYKIATVLGVTLDYFASDVYYTNPDTASIAQELFDNPDLRILFDAAKDARPEDLKMAADMLRRFKENG